MCLEVPAKVLRERVLVYVNITSQNEVNLVVVIAENLAEESEKSAGVRRDALLAVLLHKKVEDDGMERIVPLDSVLCVLIVFELNLVVLTVDIGIFL